MIRFVGGRRKRGVCLRWCPCSIFFIPPLHFDRATRRALIDDRTTVKCVTNTESQRGKWQNHQSSKNVLGCARRRPHMRTIVTIREILCEAPLRIPYRVQSFGQQIKRGHVGRKEVKIFPEITWPVDKVFNCLRYWLNHRVGTALAQEQL